MDSSLFYRFLRDVPTAVGVALVTWPEPRMRSNRDRSRYAEFIDVSKLYVSERGVSQYTLIVNDDIHDRLLCCDKQIFALGGSVKDAGQTDYFTVSSVDATDDNMNKIEALSRNGKELVGPNQTTHL